MKKILLSISALSAFFFLFSFSSSNTISAFEDITPNSEYLNSIEMGSFSEFETSSYTSDRAEWKERRQIWTDFSQGADLISIQEAINKN